MEGLFILGYFSQLLCFVVSAMCDNVTCIGNGMCNSTAGISKGSKDKQVPVDQHDKVDSNLPCCWDLWYFLCTTELASLSSVHRASTNSARAFETNRVFSMPVVKEMLARLLLASLLCIAMWECRSWHEERRTLRSILIEITPSKLSSKKLSCLSDKYETEKGIKLWKSF